MKNIKSIATAVAAAYISLTSPAAAEEADELEDIMTPVVESEAQESPLEDITLSSSASYNSVYYNRGMRFSEGPVIQMLEAINYRFLTIGLFGNLDLTDERVNEVDVLFELSNDIGILNITSGYALFLFPQGDPSRSMEVYARIGLTSPLQFNVTLAYDFEAGDGLYGEVRAGHDIQKKNLTLSLSTAVGINDEYWREGNGHNLEFRASMPVNIPGPFTVRPTVTYSLGLSEDTESVFQWSVALETD